MTRARQHACAGAPQACLATTPLAELDPSRHGSGLQLWGERVYSDSDWKSSTGKVILSIPWRALLLLKAKRVQYLHWSYQLTSALGFAKQFSGLAGRRQRRLLKLSSGFQRRRHGGLLMPGSSAVSKQETNAGLSVAADY